MKKNKRNKKEKAVAEALSHLLQNLLTHSKDHEEGLKENDINLKDVFDLYLKTEKIKETL